jgi:hypothetical protein
LNWKKQFDECTQVPGCSPLPSALFVNHIKTEDIQEPISVSKELEAFCDEFKENHGLIGVYHLNPINQEGVQEAFLTLIQDILTD